MFILLSLISHLKTDLSAAESYFSLAHFTLRSDSRRKSGTENSDHALDLRGIELQRT